MFAKKAARAGLVIAGLVVIELAAGASGLAARETAITCTNPASGASWQIRVDYDKRTVDANAARISDGEISWRDGIGANYTLDRKSGELTAIAASSTGGYFLHDRCKLG